MKHLNVSIIQPTVVVSKNSGAAASPMVSRPLKKLPSVENFTVSEGGWGWVVVVAISLVGLIMRGTTSSLKLLSNLPTVAI